MNNRGFLTVFLSLILLPCILVMSVLIEIANYYQATVYLDGISMLAANKTMSYYSSYLFEEYGVLAFDGKNSESDIMKDITNNLSHEKISLNQ